jgi:hypothetical protein
MRSGRKTGGVNRERCPFPRQGVTHTSQAGTGTKRKARAVIRHMGKECERKNFQLFSQDKVRVGWEISLGAALWGSFNTRGVGCRDRGSGGALRRRIVTRMRVDRLYEVA